MAESLEEKMRRVGKQEQQDFDKEADRFDDWLTEKVVVPASQRGGDLGEKAGAAFAAGLSTANRYFRRPDDSGMAKGEVPIYGGGKKVAREAAERVKRTVQQAQEAARKAQMGPTTIPATKKAEIIRKFQTDTPSWKGPEEINMGNVDKTFEEVLRLMKRAYEGG